MLIYEIPGRDPINIENIVLDYNGTIGHNGLLIQGVKDLLNVFAKDVSIYILTADTYGTVKKECQDINGQVLTFPKENAGEEKRRIVENLGGHKTICLGNGYNDIPMFEEAILSIGIIEGEGASGRLLTKSDIVSRNIIEALKMLMNKEMIKATLRN